MFESLLSALTQFTQPLNRAPDSPLFSTEPFYLKITNFVNGTRVTVTC
jgi:hypothetical protein